MIYQIAFGLIALLNGGWMIFDGIYVLRHGKYFGPKKPGPWSEFFVSIGVDPFQLGIPFVVLGASWIVFCGGLLLFPLPLLHAAALIVAFATLWYLPVGTIFSILAIALLVLKRELFV